MNHKGIAFGDLFKIISEGNTAIIHHSLFICATARQTGIGIIKRLRNAAVLLYVSWDAQPQQPPAQLPEEQAQLSGQPMHFLPLFLDL